MAKERRGEPESTSPGPHGMKKTLRSYSKKERVGEEARRVPGFAKEMAASGKGQFHAEKISRPMTKDEKAAELTRKMEKGYRKGYRVPKRPKSGNGRKANRSSRKSGR